MTGMPAPSSAATMSRTSWGTNWWRLWCEPSRRQVSVRRRSRPDAGSTSAQVRLRALVSGVVRKDMSGSQDRAGDVVAHAGGSGGHDVEVAGVRRKEVSGALDLDEDADLGPAEGGLGGVVELRLLQQAIAGDGFLASPFHQIGRAH